MLEKLGVKGLISDDKRSVIVFYENGKTFRGKNPIFKRLLAYRVEGGLITISPTNGKMCDYGLGVPSENRIYLIELKGSNVRDAVEQISSTILKIAHMIVGYKIFGRIVCTKCPVPDLKSIPMIKLQREIKRRGGNFKMHSMVMEEEI